MAKPSYSKPTSQIDLEERTKDGYVPSGQLLQGTDPQPAETGFVGVDPIYQNYANETEKPLLAEKGAESKFEQLAYADEVDTDFGATPAGEAEAEAEKEEKDETTQSPASTSTQASGAGATPPQTPPQPSGTQQKSSSSS
jgi:hypothetical protein